MKLFNFNSKKKPAKPGAKNASKKKFILSRKQKIIAMVGGVLVLGGAGYWAYSEYTLNDVGAGGCTSNTYRNGNRSVCIKYAQEIMNSTPGTGADVSADAVFGPKTKAKVERFQAKKHLSRDGVIGSSTWKALCKRDEDTSRSSVRNKAGCKEHKRVSTVSLYKDGSHPHTTILYSYSK